MKSKRCSLRVKMKLYLNQCVIGFIYLRMRSFLTASNKLKTVVKCLVTSEARIALLSTKWILQNGPHNWALFLACGLRQAQNNYLMSLLVVGETMIDITQPPLMLSYSSWASPRYAEEEEFVELEHVVSQTRVLNACLVIVTLHKKNWTCCPRYDGESDPLSVLEYICKSKFDQSRWHGHASICLLVQTKQYLKISR